MPPRKPVHWEDRVPDPRALHEGLLDIVLPGATPLDAVRFLRAAMAPHVAASHRVRQTLVNEVGEGMAGLADLERACRAFFKEAYFQIEAQIAEPDRVYTRAVVQVYTRGPFGDVELPAQWVGARLHVFSKLVDGRLAETSVETNVATVAFRLGALRFEPGVVTTDAPSS